MKNLQKVGGAAALCQGAGLATLVVLFFGVLPSLGLALDDFADPAKALPFVTAHPALFFWMTAVAGVIFDSFTVVLVLALHNRLEEGSPGWVRTATAFGFLTLFLFIAAAVLNYSAVKNLASLYSRNRVATESAYLALNAAINALRNGATFAAGWWSLLLSWVAVRKGGLPKSLGYFGLLVGVLNIIGLFGVPIGLLINVPWFLWLGIVLLRI